MVDRVVTRRVEDIKIGDIEKFEQIKSLRQALLLQAILLQALPDGALNLVATVRGGKQGEGKGYQYNATSDDMANVSRTIYGCSTSQNNPLDLFLRKPASGQNNPVEKTEFFNAPEDYVKIMRLPYGKFVIAKQLLHPLFDKTTEKAKGIIQGIDTNYQHYEECRNSLNKKQIQAVWFLGQKKNFASIKQEIAKAQQDLKKVEEILKKIEGQPDTEEINTNELVTILMDIFIQDTIDFLKTRGIEVEQTDTGLNLEEYSQKLNSYMGEDRTEVKKLVELMASYFVAHESVFEKSQGKKPELQQAKMEEFEKEPLNEVAHVVEEPLYVAEYVVEPQEVVVEETQKPLTALEIHIEEPIPAKPIYIENDSKIYTAEKISPTEQSYKVDLPESPNNDINKIYLPESSDKSSNKILLPENSKSLSKNPEKYGSIEQDPINIQTRTGQDKVSTYRDLPYVPILALWYVTIPGFAFALAPLQILLVLLANKKVKDKCEELGFDTIASITDGKGKEISTQDLINGFRDKALTLDDIRVNGEKLTEDQLQKISDLFKNFPPELSKVLQQELEQALKKQQAQTQKPNSKETDTESGSHNEDKNSSIHTATEEEESDEAATLNASIVKGQIGMNPRTLPDQSLVPTGDRGMW